MAVIASKETTQEAILRELKSIHLLMELGLAQYRPLHGYFWRTFIGTETTFGLLYRNDTNNPVFVVVYASTAGDAGAAIRPLVTIRRQGINVVDRFWQFNADNRVLKLILLPSEEVWHNGNYLAAAGSTQYIIGASAAFHLPTIGT